MWELIHVAEGCGLVDGGTFSKLVGSMCVSTIDLEL